MLASLLDLPSIVRSWGRGVIFIAPKFVPGEALVLEHAGDTEGDIVVNTNPEMAGLTLPELTGPAVHEMDYVGEAPVIEAPLFLSSPSMLARFTPTGLASGGRSRRSVPEEYTFVIFPERLFLKAVGSGPVSDYDLELTGGEWYLDGDALTAAQQALLGVSFWGWRGVSTTPPRRFLGGAGDARKQIETVSISLLHHPDMPEGHHLYTTGDPTAFGIDPEGGS